MFVFTTSKFDLKEKQAPQYYTMVINWLVKAKKINGLFIVNNINEKHFTFGKCLPNFSDILENVHYRRFKKGEKHREFLYFTIVKTHFL